MFKGNITTATVVTAGTNIPFKVVHNTNLNTQYDTTANDIQFNAGGKYNVNVMLNITGSTPTTIGCQLFANGVAIAESLAQTDITASTGVATLNITDTLNVQPIFNNQFANVSVRLNGNATISNGVITIEKVR